MRASWKTAEKVGDKAYIIFLEGSKYAVLAGKLRCSSLLVRDFDFSSLFFLVNSPEDC